MKKKILISFGILIVLIFLFHAPILQRLADFLAVRDNLEKADIILVLAGDSNGERVAHAVALYKQGYAPKILMSGGPAVWHLTYAENMRRQATILGVPAKDVIVQDKSKSTFEDIEFSYPLLTKYKTAKLILVTSPHHMRRARGCAKKYYNGRGIKVVAAPVEKSSFDPYRWWERHEDTQCVVSEYIAMVQYLLKGKLFYPP